MPALVSARSAARPDAWYRGLRKPPFQPPDWVFGPVWTGLYALIGLSGYRVWRARRSRARTSALRLWGAQLALNAAWSPLFFRAHAPRMALVDCGLLFAASALYARSASRVDRKAARLAVPYAGWVLFATMLNAAIVQRNRMS
jgi:tryptophan-rich sensory protein